MSNKINFASPFGKKSLLAASEFDAVVDSHMIGDAGLRSACSDAERRDTIYSQNALSQKLTTLTFVNASPPTEEAEGASSSQRTGEWVHFTTLLLEGEFVVYLHSNRYLPMGMILVIVAVVVANLVISELRAVDAGLRIASIASWLLSFSVMGYLKIQLLGLLTAAEGSANPADVVKSSNEDTRRFGGGFSGLGDEMDKDLASVLLNDKSAFSGSSSRAAVRRNAQRHGWAVLSTLVGSTIYLIWTIYNKDYCFGLQGAERAFLCTDAITNDGLMIFMLPFSFAYLPMKFAHYASVVLVLEVGLHLIRFAPPMNVVSAGALATSAVFNAAAVITCFIAAYRAEKRTRRAFDEFVDLHMRVVEDFLVKRRKLQLQAATVPGHMPPPSLIAKHAGRPMWWFTPEGYVLVFGIRHFVSWSAYRAPIDAADLVQRWLTSIDAQVSMFCRHFNTAVEVVTSSEILCSIGNEKRNRSNGDLDSACSIASPCQLMVTRGQPFGDEIAIAFHLGPLQHSLEYHNRRPSEQQNKSKGVKRGRATLLNQSSQSQCTVSEDTLPMPPQGLVASASDTIDLSTTSSKDRPAVSNRESTQRLLLCLTAFAATVKERCDKDVLSSSQREIVTAMNPHIASSDVIEGNHATRVAQLSVGADWGEVGVSLSSSLGAVALYGLAVDNARRCLDHLRGASCGSSFLAIYEPLLEVMRSAEMQAPNRRVEGIARSEVLLCHDIHQSNGGMRKDVEVHVLVLPWAPPPTLTVGGRRDSVELLASAPQSSSGIRDGDGAEAGSSLNPLTVVNRLVAADNRRESNPSLAKIVPRQLEAPLHSEFPKNNNSNDDEVTTAIAELHRKTEIRSSFPMLQWFMCDQTEIDYQVYRELYEAPVSVIGVLAYPLTLLVFAFSLLCALGLYGITTMNDDTNASRENANASFALRSPMLWTILALVAGIAALIFEVVVTGAAAHVVRQLASVMTPIKWGGHQDMVPPDAVSLHPKVFFAIQELLFIAYGASFCMTIFSSPQGTALGNGRLIWMFSLLALSYSRRRSFGPFVTWLQSELLICIAFLVESFYMVRFHDTSIRNTMTDCAAAAGFLVLRLLHDNSLRVHFQTRMYVCYLDTIISEKYCELQSALQRVAPEGLAGQLLDRVRALHPRIRRSKHDGSRNGAVYHLLHPDHSTLLTTSTDDGELIMLEFRLAPRIADAVTSLPGQTLSDERTFLTLSEEVAVAHTVEASVLRVIAPFSAYLHVVKSTGRFIVIRALHEHAKSSDLRCVSILQALPRIIQAMKECDPRIQFRCILTSGPLVGALVGVSGANFDLYGESIAMGRVLLEAMGSDVFSNSCFATARFLRRALTGLHSSSQREGVEWLHREYDSIPQGGDGGSVPSLAIRIDSGNVIEVPSGGLRAAVRVAGCPPLRLYPLLVTTVSATLRRAMNYVPIVLQQQAADVSVKGTTAQWRTDAL